MMQHLRAYIAERFHQKRLTAKTSAALLVQVCKRFVVYPEALHGKLQWRVLFLRAHPHEDKLWFFLRKQEILTACREELVRAWSRVPIEDLRFSA